jgi:Pyrimidine dimer DNA glycosylase
MRLWTLHPRYLDSKGIVALWREALLARAVLSGRTRGYRSHPQLRRFQSCRKPLEAIEYYLRIVYDEATRRGYHFERRKIRRGLSRIRIKTTRGQLMFELGHLKKKLRRRDLIRYRGLKEIQRPAPHPLFRVIKGPIENWEKTNP